MKTNFIVTGFILGTIVAMALSLDCPATEISFARKQGACEDYEHGEVSHSTPMLKDRYRINYFVDNFLPFCTAKVCGDGRYHQGFCTTSGSIPGECIAGDPADNFRKLYEGKVGSVAETVSTLAVFPALVKVLVHEFTTEERSITLYESGKQKGDSITITSRVGQCINLPRNWQMRVSSYGAKNLARFYTEEDCTGHSVVACRDFVQNDFWSQSNNLWGLLCSIDGINDNTRSFKFE